MRRIIAFILLIAAILTVIWFRNGYIIGGSEDGLIFYKISQYFHQGQYTWMEYPGIGSPSLSLIAGKPTFYLLAFIQNLGVPGYLIQAVVFWLILISAGLGILFLSKELFPKLPLRYLLISVLFYWFNPIGLADLLNRSLLNYLFFYAMLPIATYFYIKGLRKEKYIWAFLLNLILIFYSYVFSYIAFIILYWFWLILISIFSLLVNRQKIFILKYFLLNLALFIVLHSWWILPIVALKITGGASPTTDLFKTQSNLDMLKALSASGGGVSSIFKLIDSFFLSLGSLSWVKLYYSSVLFIIEYFFVGAILFFIIKSRKNPTVLFLGGLFLTIIFLAKGSNPPFGEIYSFIFKNVLIFQVFRNPFEKFSFLLSLIASILLAPSIYELTKKLRQNLTNLSYLFVLAILFLYLAFPLYSGLAMTNKYPPTNDYSIGYKVKVPDYYQDLDHWLITQGDNFRYIGFPVAPEGITYKWEKGYTGVELPVALFSNSGILLNTSAPFFNLVVPNIETTILSSQDFSLYANLINAKYYLVRSDIDFKTRNMNNPQMTENKLTERAKAGEVKKLTTFGKITVWENLKWQDTQFYVANQFIKVNRFDKDTDLAAIDVLKNEVLIDKDDLLKLGSLAQAKESSLPSVAYEKINPTKYVVHLMNVQEPFLLVFSELYNDGWQAFVNKRELSTHMRVNLFANSWVVNQRGNFDVIVEFSPQKWMDYGERLSLIGIVIVAAGVCFFLYKYREKNHN